MAEYEMPSSATTLAAILVPSSDIDAWPSMRPPSWSKAPVFRFQRSTCSYWLGAPTTMLPSGVISVGTMRSGDSRNVGAPEYFWNLMSAVVGAPGVTSTVVQEHRLSASESVPSVAPL